MRWRYYILALVLSLSATPVFAANHYIREGGLGSTSGTGNCADWSEANACANLPATMVRGDTYYFADGSYTGKTFTTASSGTTTITLQKATVAAHGTATGWDNAYGDGLATFTSKIKFSTGYWVMDGVTGGGPTNSWNQNFGFKVWVTTDNTELIEVGGNGEGNVTLSHIEFEGKGSEDAALGFQNNGLIVYGATPNVTLSYFWMHGIGSTPLKLEGWNITVEYGWVESFFASSAQHGEVSAMALTGGTVGDHTFRYNLFTDVQSTGGLIWNNAGNASAALYIYGNIFYRPSASTWSHSNGVIGGLTNGRFSNVFVYNNTFINVNIPSLTTAPNTYSGNVAKNNLFYESTAPSFSRFATHDYNHFINSGTVQGEAGGTTSAGDPFSDFVGLDFSLVASSGPIDVGTPLGTPYDIDPLGTSRTEGTTYDAGAYEYGQGGPSNPPVPPPQPPPAAAGYYQANERPTAGSRTTAGTRRELEISGGPYVLDENHSPAEAIVNENDTLLMEE